MSIAMLFAAFAAVGVASCLGIVLLEAVRQRQRRAWQAEYRARGGLAGALYRRFRRPPRLTYRDGDEEPR